MTSPGIRRGLKYDLPQHTASSSRVQRRLGIDFDSLPKDPPYRVSLYNLPTSMEEKDINERFFQNLKVIRADFTKSSTTVELASKQDLYEALCKDGSNIKGRTVNVCLFGQTPPNAHNTDRYSGRSGNSSHSDRFSDQNQGGYKGPRTSDKFGDRDRSSGLKSTPQDKMKAAPTFYANAKFLSPPLASLLPMPPKSWLKNRAEASR